jgi:pyridoxal biosynthesis lyase PdxS
MKAELLLKERHVIGPSRFIELKVWRVEQPVRGSAHDLKYSLVCIVNGACVLRYDNEAGKGDHKHVGDLEVVYSFTTAEQLLADFWNEVEVWRLK